MNAMEHAWGVEMPVRRKDFLGPEALEKQFRRCRCGQFTFLPLPCQACGSKQTEPALDHALRRAKLERAKRWLLAVPFLAAVCALAALIWRPLAVLPCVVTIAALVSDLRSADAQAEACFWLFHKNARGKPLLADPEVVEAIADGYDADLRRLERMLDQDEGVECALKVLNMARDLAGIYHNRRTCALMMRCLLRLPVSEGIYIDIDQVCAWLMPEDLPDEEASLAKLAECARFTCLRMGAPTAGFVVRCYEARLRLAEPKCPVRKMFGQKERLYMAKLWNASSVGISRDNEAARNLDAAFRGERGSMEAILRDKWPTRKVVAL